jgi:hypothetical protein
MSADWLNFRYNVDVNQAAKLLVPFVLTQSECRKSQSLVHHYFLDRFSDLLRKT